MALTKLLAAALAALVLAAPASAGVIYENDALNGTYAGNLIDVTQSVSDAFSVAAASTVTSATVGLWSDHGAAPTTLNWAFGSSAFASDLGSGTSTLANAFAFVSGQYDIYLSTFSLNVPLAAGNYWFTLNDGTSTGGSIYWDINFGPSEARFRQSDSSGATDSEYFKLSGDAGVDPGPGTDPSPVPEPGSIALLAIGMIGLAARRRRPGEIA